MIWVRVQGLGLMLSNTKPGFADSETEIQELIKEVGIEKGDTRIKCENLLDKSGCRKDHS